MCQIKDITYELGVCFKVKNSYHNFDYAPLNGSKKELTQCFVRTTTDFIHSNMRCLSKVVGQNYFYYLLQNSW